jgi:hypothetical protein
VKFLICVAALAMLAPTASAHDHWINAGEYRDPVSSNLCCGESDCGALDPQFIVRTEDGFYLMTTGETIPNDRVLVSEDGRFWRCHYPDGSTRCFFAPFQGS